MIKILNIWFLLFCFSQTLYSQTDTILKRKSTSLGAHFATGITWRVNYNVDDSHVFTKVNSKNEIPGYASEIGFNFLTKRKSLLYSLGLDFSYFEFKNSNFGYYEITSFNATGNPIDSVKINADYCYKHSFFSIPFRIQFILNKKMGIKLGLTFKTSYLFNYSFEREGKNYNWYKWRNNGLKFFYGPSIERSTVSRNNLKFNYGIQLNLSDKIGGKSIEARKAGYSSYYYVFSKPYRLISPLIYIGLIFN
jgi:hypothetical protein